MPDTTPGGLHTPVTNIVSTEATVAQEQVSEGADGEGAALPMPPDGAAERGANKIIRFLVERGGRLDVASKPTVRAPTVDNEPPLNIPAQTPLDSALDADPPKPETAALIRELMGLPPQSDEDRGFRRTR